MSQSKLIVGALVFGFIIFVVVKGQLPGYLKVVGI